MKDILKLDELKTNIVKLVETKFELKKLEVQGKAEDLLAPILVKIMVGLFCFLAFILGNILLADILNIAFESLWLGYFILMLIYIILALLIYKNIEKISEMIKTKIRQG